MSVYNDFPVSSSKKWSFLSTSQCLVAFLKGKLRQIILNVLKTSKSLADNMPVSFYAWFEASNVINCCPKSFTKLSYEPNAQQQPSNIMECFRKTSAIYPPSKLVLTVFHPNAFEDGGSERRKRCAPFFSRELNAERDVPGSDRML